MAERCVHGPSSAELAELLICILSLAAGDAFDAPATNGILPALEKSMLPGNIGTALVTHVAAISLWREDVATLIPLRSADWFHFHIARCLTGDLLGAEAPAWAAIAILLMSVAGGNRSQLQGDRDAMMQLGQAVGLYRASSWLGALQNSKEQTKAFATLALAVAAFASSRIVANQDARYMLPDTSELSSLVSACAANAASSMCQMLRDASYLAIVVLLTCPTYPKHEQARLLHSASCQQQVFQRLLEGTVIELDSDAASPNAGATTLSTAPALLYSLLLLRSRPSWLEPSMLMPQAMPLARIAQQPVGEGRSSRRLLALRVVEALIAEEPSEQLSPCCAAVLQPLLGHAAAWADAAEEALEARESRQLLGALAPGPPQPAATGADGEPGGLAGRCMRQLHGGLSDRLCAELGG